MCAGLSSLREKLRAHCVDFGEQSAQRVLIDLRVAPERRKHLFLPLELLQHVGLEIGSCGDVGHVE